MYRFLILSIYVVVFTNCYRYSYDYYSVEKKSGKHGVIKRVDIYNDSSVTKYIPFEYDTFFEPMDLGMWYETSDGGEYIDYPYIDWFVAAKQNYLYFIDFSKPNKHHKTKQQYEDVKFSYQVGDYKKLIVAVKQNGFWGIINKNEERLIPIIYDEIDNENISNSFAAVRKGEKWGICDFNGNETVPFIYDSLDFVVEDSFIVAQKDGKMGLISKTNRIVIPFEYTTINSWIGKETWKYNNGYLDSFLYYTDYGYANFYPNLVVEKEDKVGLLNAKNQTVVSIDYDLISIAYKKKKKRIFVGLKDKKFGLINAQNQIILPFEYAQIKRFRYNRNYAHIIKNNKVGVYNYKTQKVMFEPKFDVVIDFIDRIKPLSAFAAVKQDGKRYWIDKKGNIIKPIF